MPKATRYQGDFFPALKKSALESFFPVKYEIRRNFAFEINFYDVRPYSIAKYKNLKHKSKIVILRYGFLF